MKCMGASGESSTKCDNVYFFVEKVVLKNLVVGFDFEAYNKNS